MVQVPVPTSSGKVACAIDTVESHPLECAADTPTTADPPSNPASSDPWYSEVYVPDTGPDVVTPLPSGTLTRVSSPVS